MRYALLGLMAFSALVACQSPARAQRFSVAPASLLFGSPARPLPASLQSSYNAAPGPACRNPDLWVGYDPCETCGSKCQQCETCTPKKRYSGMLTSFHSAIGAFKRKKAGCCSEPACTSAPSCGCEQPASCGCEAEPACGCEAPSCTDEATCCGATSKKCKWGLLVWLKKKINCKKKGCCDTPCDSCTAAPACTSCQAEPAPKCAGGSCSSFDDNYPVETPAAEPTLQPVPAYQPSYQPHAHEPAPAVVPETVMEMIPAEPAEAEETEPASEPTPEAITPPNPFKDDPSVPSPSNDAPPAADPEAPPVPFDGPNLDASTGSKDVKPVGHQQLLNKFFLELRGDKQPTTPAPTPAPASSKPRELTTQQQQAAPQETSKLYWQPRNTATTAPAVQPVATTPADAAATKEPKLLPSTLIRFDQSR